jgi:thiol-disulfide isomerase/thioredoxin
MPIVRSASVLASAALVALLTAACQPAGETAEGPAAETPAAAAEAGADTGGAASSLARFATGEFERLDFSQNLPLPASPVQDAAGAQTNLAGYKGKVVVLNMWGEWCAPCVEEMPTLARLQEAFPEKVAVVPVAFGPASDLEKSAVKLKELAGETLPFFYDSEFNISADVKTGAFPSTMVYNAEGIEVARLNFPADWASDQAKALVQAVIDGES